MTRYQLLCHAHAPPTPEQFKLLGAALHRVLTQFRHMVIYQSNLTGGQAISFYLPGDPNLRVNLTPDHLEIDLRNPGNASLSRLLLLTCLDHMQHWGDVDINTTMLNLKVWQADWARSSDQPPPRLSLENPWE